MAKKKKEEIKIEEITAPISPVSPLFSNVVSVFSHPHTVMLDFGFAAPRYRQPHDVEDSQIARICLSWDSAESLAKFLSDVISEHKKELESKRKAKK